MDELKIITKARKLAINCYNTTKNLPDSEKFGIISQMNRCSVSVGSNIVEGNSRNSNKEFLRFLHIAKGSLEELRFQNSIIKEIYGIEIDDNLLQEVSKMLFCLIRTKREMLSDL